MIEMFLGAEKVEKLEHLEVVIFSDPDYDHLVAEIYYDDYLVAFIHQDKGRRRPMLVFPHGKGILNEVDLSWFESAVKIAADHLLVDSTVPDIIDN